jgi:AAA domain
MRTIATTINKGGVRKATLAKHLAEAAAAGGHNAMLLDMDAQQNSTSWASAGISSRRTRCQLFDSSPRTTCRRNWAVPAGAEVRLSASATALLKHALAAASCWSVSFQPCVTHRPTGEGRAMPGIDDVMTDLRHRIMGPIESGSPKPVPEPGDLDQRRGSAAVALRRLSHPERDGVVAEDTPAVSELVGRLEEIVAIIKRNAELNAELNAAPRPAETTTPAALVQAIPAPQDDDTGKTAITLLFDTQVLARIDADARRIGISRAAWLHVAAGERLEDRR